ncbi:MAG: hypothetical protein R3F59_05780 [Myxococcota bacterium]
MLEDLEVEYHGTPVPWGDLPPVLREDAFRATVAEAVADCAPEVEVVGYECREPPCLAMVRAPAERAWWDALVVDCPPWVDAYGVGAVGGARRATCADGHQEVFQLVGWSPQLVEPEGGYPTEEAENRVKRLAARTDEIARSWRCAEGD